VYVPNSAKFEGQSTNKSDFMPTEKIVRREDYAPKNHYVAVKDDRDFVSTTRGSHTPKPLPTCAAVQWLAKPHEVHKDGHVFLKETIDH
jgi:spore germination cell wall hydrolase CwlJ-like protein